MRRASAPLEGLTVVEHTESVAGAYAGRVLATLGAKTILVEPEEGHALRQRRPLLPNGSSSIFTYLAAGKRSIVADLRSPVGQDRLKALLDSADIYIDDFSQKQRELFGVTDDQILEDQPRLIYLSVRPFGMKGPKSDWAAEEVTLFHSSGEGYLMPNGLAYESHPERPPLRVFGYFAEMQGGIAAALGGLVALLSGGGKVVDSSVQDALIALTAFGVQRYADGSIEHRSTRSFKYGGVLECQGGYVELLTLEDRQWRGLVELMGNPGWALDPELADSEARGRCGPEINKKLRSWARRLPADELVKAAQKLGVPVAKYASPAEILHGAHEVARGLFQPVEVSGMGEIPVLVAPYQFDGLPLTLGAGPPEIGTSLRAQDLFTGMEFNNG